ncbi:MAG TPA: DUF3343 domain-containing protein [Symbiobacteriaceae bacterium]|nr:DUF3343 domain-containing protein [Symbiobacteriaceae bacterium]
MRELDGIITFFSSYHAVRAERVLEVHNIRCRTVPCPRELSSSCGVALRFPYHECRRVTELLSHAAVQVESVQSHPEEQALPGGWKAILQRGRRLGDRGEGS